MITVASLHKPCTLQQRAEFIVKYNHQGNLQIKENEYEIAAMDYSEDEKLSMQVEAEIQKSITATNTKIDEMIHSMGLAILSGDKAMEEALRAEFNELMGVNANVSA